MEGGVPGHMPEVVVALTGASGAKYCVRLIEALVEHKWSVRLIVTGTGAINLDLECSMTPSELASMDGVILEDNGNLAAKSASGSARFDAYVVCPASGTTIGKIAAGISDNLATRSAGGHEGEEEIDNCPKRSAILNPSSQGDVQSV